MRLAGELARDLILLPFDAVRSSVCITANEI
jgi:hypothetical protein